MPEDAQTTLTRILGTIVEGLVDREDQINIETVVTGGGGEPGSTVVFNIDVAKEDVGKLIGRSGKTAGAIRHVMGAASAKLKVRTIVAIPDKKSTAE